MRFGVLCTFFNVSLVSSKVKLTILTLMSVSLTRLLVQWVCFVPSTILSSRYPRSAMLKNTSVLCCPPGSACNSPSKVILSRTSFGQCALHVGGKISETHFYSSTIPVCSVQSPQLLSLVSQTKGVGCFCDRFNVDIKMFYLAFASTLKADSERVLPLYRRQKRRYSDAK